MVKRKLDGAMDKSSADREICKSDTIVHNLWKIWRPAPSGTESYGRQEGCFIKCEILRSLMISYQSLLYSTTLLYEDKKIKNLKGIQLTAVKYQQ